ncbi:MAG: D-alanyl-D-alanine carboxypeptidase family protein [bacterium]
MITRFLLMLLVFLFSSLVLAAPRPVPAPPVLKAKGYLLQDFDSGKILVEHNADEQIEPASITKVMTAYVIYQAIEDGTIGMDDEVLISEKAWRMKGSRMFIEVNKKVPVHDLLKGLIIQSGNDAAVALAEHVAGSEEGFVELMNAAAKRLGMLDTHFMNATGWPDPNHYTTAKDIAKMVAATIRDFPDHYAMYKEKEFKYNGIKQSNRNRLLWLDKTVDGVKTGHTQSAGYCLAASAEREGMRLMSVVLGTDKDGARTSQSRALLNYGFRFYETRKIYSPDTPVAEAHVWKGDADTVQLGVTRDFYITFPRGQYDHLDAKLDRERNIEAPVKAGDQLGTVRIMLGDKLIDSRPLVAINSVEEGGVFRRIIDSLMLLRE